jgi:hypothetical protein
VCFLRVNLVSGTRELFRHSPRCYSDAIRPKVRFGYKSVRMLRSIMQTEQIVALLVAERNRLDAAIQALQGPAKHRGRPPVTKVSAPAVSASSPYARKRKISAAGRKAMADAAKKRWAAIKAGKAPNPFKKTKRKTAKKG